MPRKRKPPKNCKHCGAFIKGSGKVCLSCLKENPKKKNPIAIYNPQRGTVLPAEVVEIRYRRTSGAYAGQYFKHRFKKPGPRVFGMKDGSVLIRGQKRLWGTAEQDGK